MKKISLLILSLCMVQVYAADLSFEDFAKQGEQQQLQLRKTIENSHSGSLETLFNDVKFAVPFTSKKKYEESLSRESVLLEEHKGLVSVRKRKVPCVKRLATSFRSKRSKI